jgi:membrane associated rhomboid family serine protease
MEWMIGLLFLLEMVLPIPIKDKRGRQGGYPAATLSLVAINVIVHLALTWAVSQDRVAPEWMFWTFGIVPNAVFEQSGLGALALITSGFLHGGWLHLVGNVFLLWFFGRKVEDLTGSLRFFAFYLLCLLAAGITSAIGRHALSPLEGSIPAIGASGAVSGVMAAYLFLFAGERITTLVLPIPFPFPLPAWVYVVYNLSHDLLLGLLAEEFVREHGFSPFGTDVFAHLGGLLAGLIFIYLYLLPDALVDRRRGR